MSVSTKRSSDVLRGDLNLDAKVSQKTDPAILKRGVLALDPGSARTGWAWWRTAEEITPTQAGVLQGGKGSLGERLLSVRAQLQEIYDTIHSLDVPLGSIACEKPIPFHKFKAPELEAMYAEIRNWTKGLSKKRGPSPGLIVRSYANTQVKAVVNPRLGDWKTDGNAKEKLLAGVVAQFGLEWRHYPEDAIDAIAVGIAHLQVVRGELLVNELLNE